MKFKSRREAYGWIVANQLSRRNCTPETRDYLIGKRYKNEKRPVGRPNKLEQNVLISTADDLGKELGLTGMTIRRAEAFADAIDKIVGIFEGKKKNSVKTFLLSVESKLAKKDILELSELPKKHIIEVIDQKKELWQVKYERQRRKNVSNKNKGRVILVNFRTFGRGLGCRS